MKNSVLDVSKAVTLVPEVSSKPRVLCHSNIPESLETGIPKWDIWNPKENIGPWKNPIELNPWKTQQVDCWKQSSWKCSLYLKHHQHSQESSSWWAFLNGSSSSRRPRTRTRLWSRARLRPWPRPRSWLRLWLWTWASLILKRRPWSISENQFKN